MGNDGSQTDSELPKWLGVKRPIRKELDGRTHGVQMAASAAVQVQSPAAALGTA